MVISCDYHSIESLHFYNRHNYYLVERDGMYGIIKDDSALILDCVYQNIIPTDKFFNVMKDNDWQIFDEEEGDVDELHGSEEFENHAIVKYKGYSGIWSFEEDKLIEPPSYNSIIKKNGYYILSFKVGLFVVAAGMCDMDMDLIIPFEYSNISFLSNDLIKVKRGIECGVIKISGEKVLETDYEDIRLHDNRFIVRHEKLWKVLDHDGDTICSAPKKVYAIDLYNNWKSENKKKNKRPRIKYIPKKND